MIQFSLYMMMFYVNYTNLEIMLNHILTVLISLPAPAHHLETINCFLISYCTFTHYIVKYLCDIITIIKHMYISHTYSCVDMCRCTNQYWLCDKPKQLLPQFLSALVKLETPTLSPTHG